jgi:hypothetical protein
MKLFESSVVIGCDQSPDQIKDARAIRAVLESFGLRVHLYDLTRKRDALQFLAGEIADCEYVVLCCHGGPGDMIKLRMSDQKDGDYDCPDGWEIIDFALTADNIPDHVRGRGRTLLCVACAAGQETLAQAFFMAGYRAYIASSQSVLGWAGILFVIGFFYHLITANRIDDAPTSYTDAEAVSLASRMDAQCARGTLPFRYFTQAQEQETQTNSRESG